jgi:hypothetical protein
MESKLAQELRKELNGIVREWTPEQRLIAFATHNELVMQLYIAGKKIGAASNAISNHDKP